MRARTPGPQSRRSRPGPSTRYPDWAPPGFGHAGEQPTTVKCTFIYLRIVAGKIRVVIAKPGLDGHDRGAKIIARALRDAGMEVIYTGLHQTPEQIVETAIQEDADAVGISILSGAHMTLVPRILDGLRDNGLDDVLVVVGGTIPTEDVVELKRRGVAEVFTPGAPTAEIVEFLRDKVPA
jgi:methylmalonyl-CoA mutase C-terminal domain/subunit